MVKIIVIVNVSLLCKKKQRNIYFLFLLKDIITKTAESKIENLTNYVHIKTHRPVFWSSFFLVVLNIAEKTKLGKNNVVLKDALLLE